MRSNGALPTEPELRDAISAAMVELYDEFYDHDRTTATTYINDNVVVCILALTLRPIRRSGIGPSVDRDRAGTAG